MNGRPFSLQLIANWPFGGAVSGFTLDFFNQADDPS